MGEHSKIEWTNDTWNPWQGCHHVSPGCEHCYMFREKRMYGQNPDVVVRSKPPTFNLPYKLKGPLVFTCSWSDFFIKEADPWRDEAWEIIRQTPHLTYQILTKRIERAQARLPWGDGTSWPNVQGIVSVEDQPTADRRIPILLQTNFAVRGISAEPLLGPIDLRQIVYQGLVALDTLSRPILVGCPTPHEPDEKHRNGLDWVILGGESGPHARPMHPDWARSLRDQCHAAGVPFFFKQWGEWLPKDQEDNCDVVVLSDAGPRMHNWTPKPFPQYDALKVGKKAAGRILDGRTWDEFPKVPA